MKRVLAATVVMSSVLFLMLFLASDFAGAAGRAEKKGIMSKENETMMKDEGTMRNKSDKMMKEEKTMDTGNEMMKDEGTMKKESDKMMKEEGTMK